MKLSSDHIVWFYNYFCRRLSCYPFYVAMNCRQIFLGMQVVLHLIIYIHGSGFQSYDGVFVAMMMKWPFYL